MIKEIIKWFIISLILIILIHHLYFFFKNTLSTPKTKDLINKPLDFYNKINSNASSKLPESNSSSYIDGDSSEASNITNSHVNNSDTTKLSDINNNTIKLISSNSGSGSNNEIDKGEMKNELKNFFKELSVNPAPTSQDLVYSQY